MLRGQEPPTPRPPRPLPAVTTTALTLLLAAAALSACATAHGETDPQALPTRVLEPPSAAWQVPVGEGRTIARSLVAEERLPGLSLAVAVDGQTVWAEGFGWASLEERLPVTPETLFRIGGVSEVLTAAAVGLLFERDRLDLDAPVQRYVPAFPEKEWPISTRQLMAHTAGVRHNFGEEEVIRTTGCADDAARLATFAGDPLRFRPGAARSYSDNGWVLVGAAVGAAANEPYLDFVRREILAPLEMKHTVADLDGPVEPGSAHFYYPVFMLNPRRGLHDSPAVDLSCLLPASGFLSTPADLVRFGSAMMSGELLAPATVKNLWMPMPLTSGGDGDQALGWAVQRLPMGAGGTPTIVVGQGLGAAVQRSLLGATTIGGHVSGGTTSLMVLPEHRIAIAVATNTSGADNTAVLAQRLADVFVRLLEARAVRPRPA